MRMMYIMYRLGGVEDSGGGGEVYSIQIVGAYEVFGAQWSSILVFRTMWRLRRSVEVVYGTF